MVKATHKGLAKPDDKVFNRGFTINVKPKPPKKEEQEKEEVKKE